MFSSPSGVMINGGTFHAVTAINQSQRGLNTLMDWVATGAFHNSDELCDEPKCHPHTRLAVLDDIMKWVELEEQEEFMMWLFGPAGAGKSAIAKRLAELAAGKGRLIGTFFFSRTSSMRNIKDFLIPTLAYQMAVSIPGTRNYIEDAIEADPAIFKKNLQTQIDTLLIQPFRFGSTQTTPSPNLIIIDGLDECSNSKAQLSILNAISNSFHKHNPLVLFLVVSRPEVDIVSSFNSNEPLKSIHRRLALDDKYQPDHDIRLFFSDKFEQIRCNHRLRSTIPKPWPTEEVLKMLVEKSSGQFIFAATVVKFVESNRHRPTARLNVVLGISPPGTNINPFTELDALYKQVLSSVDDIELTLRVLSLYTAAPFLAARLQVDTGTRRHYMSADLFLSLEQGDVDLALINLSSIVSYDESSDEVKILHASFVDFLSDKHRSNEFYIDMASSCTDFVCRTIQCVRVPDGIQAGDDFLLLSGFRVPGWTLNSQLRSDILNFDFDAFITTAIERLKDVGDYLFGPRVITAYETWMSGLIRASLQAKGDRQLEEALSQCNSSFESRVQKYESDSRLQLLMALALVTLNYGKQYRHLECMCLDILLKMDDHELHLIDRDALGLRHNRGILSAISCRQIIEIISSYIDGDRYALAALHCMSFLSNPPKYSESNDSPDTGLIYVEWRAICEMALDVLPKLLARANPSPELVEYTRNQNIDSEVRKKFPVILVWEIDIDILAFLSRACVCVNWRIISAIRQCPITMGESLWQSEKYDARLDEQEDIEMISRLRRGRVDQCCNDI